MHRLLFLLIVFMPLRLCLAGAGPDSLFRSDIRVSFSYHLQLNHFDLSPSLLLIPGKKAEAGTGINYLHYYRNTDLTGMSSAGFHAFGRFFPFEKIFLHGEYLYMRVPYLRELDYSYTKVSVATVLAGAGYRQPFSDKISGYLYMLYDLNYNELSAYQSKVLLKAGISF